MSKWEEFTAYQGLIADAKREERERIIAEIRGRVSDLRSCTKNDNCQELGELIESYIPEWTDPA